jgi:hypothetical protein
MAHLREEDLKIFQSSRTKVLYATFKTLDFTNFSKSLHPTV